MFMLSNADLHYEGSGIHYPCIFFNKTIAIKKLYTLENFNYVNYHIFC